LLFFFPQAGLDHDILILHFFAIAWMTAAYHNAQHFSVEMGVSQTFLLGLAYNHSLPDLSLLCSLG
jgi:hypothetical protein